MKSKKKNGGFTLVELLATLAILSLVVSIVTYSAVGIVNNAKEKSYETTINNIKVATKNYAVEQVDETFKWKEFKDSSNCLSGETCEYQCVTIQKLIDTGYFSSDVLDSYKGEGEENRIKLDDMVYVQRNLATKTITHQDLYYLHPCSMNTDVEEKEPSGKVEIVVDYINGAANVKIYYDLAYISENYKYKLEYDFDNDQESKKVFSSSSTPEEPTTMQLNTNGTVIARILTSDGNTELAKATHFISFDVTSPIVTLSSTNNVKETQILTITMSDAETGISSYSITGPGVDESGVDAPTNGIKITISEAGTYTVSAKDGVGNNTTKSIKYVRTDFVVDGGVPTPNYMITIADKQISELPEKKITNICDYSWMAGSSSCKDYVPKEFYVTLSGSNNRFRGWYGSKTMQSFLGINLGYVYGDYIGTSYTPTKDTTLYGEGWKYTEPTPESKITYTVTYKANGGIGSDVIVNVEEGTNYTVSSNMFTRNGYTFTGWNRNPNGSAAPYSAGSVIKNMTSNITLYAQWKKECSLVCPSGKTLISGKCCPSDEYNSVSGNYCVKKSHYISDGKCYFRINMGYVSGYLDRDDKRGTCLNYAGSSFTFNDVIEYGKVDNKNCTGQNGWRVNPCVHYGLLTCVSNSLGDCTEEATNPVCK